jgi:hypothetical protein
VRHVLDFLALVNQSRSVVDQPHRDLWRHTGAAQPVDEGDAQAMESQVWILDLEKMAASAATVGSFIGHNNKPIFTVCQLVWCRTRARHSLHFAVWPAAGCGASNISNPDLPLTSASTTYELSGCTSDALPNHAPSVSIATNAWKWQRRSEHFKLVSIKFAGR